MCTKIVERILDFNHEIKQLYEITLEEDLRYIKSDIGINANGYIYVIGKYDDGNGIKDFEELLEVDILAPFEKITDENTFNINVENFDYHVFHGDLWLEINLKIEGLLEENKKIEVEEQSIPENIEEMEEKKRQEELVKNNNINEIEEKIDEYLFITDEDNLTADKLTTIINKVIDNNRDTIEVSMNIDNESQAEIEKDEINQNEINELDNEMDENNSKDDSKMKEMMNFKADILIPYDDFEHEEDIYQELYKDHMLEMKEQEEKNFFDRVSKDILEDAVYDHIMDIREVIAFLEEAPNTCYDHIQNEEDRVKEKEEEHHSKTMENCNCNSSCSLNDTMNEEIKNENTQFNISFEKSYDKFVFYSNPKQEYEYQHDKCVKNHEAKKKPESSNLSSQPSQFQFPLYKEEDELCEIPKFEGGFYMNDKVNDNTQSELNDYSVEQFMNDLDLFEDELLEDCEDEVIIDTIPNDELIEDVKEKDEKKEKKEVKDSKEIFDDILDDKKTTKSCIKYVVVRNGDTYASLAHRYGVDEKTLAKWNKYKVLESRCIIEIPIG